jgi:hypothetical protein
MDDIKVENLLRGKVGRALLASFADVATWKVADAVGVDLGGTPYSDGETRHSSAEWRESDAARARWHEARQVVEEAVAQGKGSMERELRTIGKYQLLRRVGGLTEDIAFGGGADWLVLAPALEAAREELRPVAELVAGLPEAAWWWDPVVLDSQRWLAERNVGLPRGDRMSLGLRRAAERAIDPGWWASELVGSGVPRTTRGNIPGAQAISLACPEGFEIFGDLRQVWSIRIDRSARVYEVAGIEDWAALARDYPYHLPVGYGRDWARWTGKQGTWVIPDWVAVSQDWDGVHVSLGGYLEAAYRAADAGGGFTVLAGWNPDETLWLSDVVSTADLLGDIRPDQHWAIMADQHN